MMATRRIENGSKSKISRTSRSFKRIGTSHRLLTNDITLHAQALDQRAQSREDRLQTEMELSGLQISVIVVAQEVMQTGRLFRAKWDLRAVSSSNWWVMPCSLQSLKIDCRPSSSLRDIHARQVSWRVRCWSKRLMMLLKSLQHKRSIHCNYYRHPQLKMIRWAWAWLLSINLICRSCLSIRVRKVKQLA